MRVRAAVWKLLLLSMGRREQPTQEHPLARQHVKPNKGLRFSVHPSPASELDISWFLDWQRRQEENQFKRLPLIVEQPWAEGFYLKCLTTNLSLISAFWDFFPHWHISYQQILGKRKCVICVSSILQRAVSSLPPIWSVLGSCSETLGESLSLDLWSCSFAGC